ncbi:hypothetical protein ACFU0X_19915 [Streptomyces cellulosae]|uniref:Uncharacterized protein n=1 Tax=Streptomyces cellulosae TaxID=1968 RepID=A0ABW6JIQ8_STRCE
MPARTRVATIWILHAEGRAQLGLADAGHVDADRIWEQADALPVGSERAVAMDRFNPVELNLALEDVEAAVAKWEGIAGVAGVCHVQEHDKDPYTAVRRLLA